MSFQPSLVNDYRLSDRTRMVHALASLRQEWQEAVGGSLLKVETPVGLLLADIAEKLELSSQERHIFLGGKLANEVDAYKEAQVSRKPFI